ncbi:hypothetical protein [Aquimarina pacifica]|uniref:hypothetical protein n=1 Tax=Aquimarina pacifica TaxID=1296415 RepID=UPI00046F2317|nr:hypothetical protein [Aquimarina pacifica]
MKKITTLLFFIALGMTSMVQAQLFSNSFNLDSNHGDLLMRRYSAGDLDWKRALVPISSTNQLVINYGGDFIGGTRIMGNSVLIDGSLTTDQVNFYNDEEGAVTGYIKADTQGLDLISSGDEMSLRSGNNLNFYASEVGTYADIQFFRGEELNIRTSYGTTFTGEGNFNINNMDEINVSVSNDVAINAGQGVNIQAEEFSVGAKSSFTRSISWGTTGALLNTDQGASMELRGTGTPYLDFSNDASTDYDMRLILTGNNTLGVSGGNLVVDGTINAKEIHVKSNVWSDFVFYDNYKLPTLAEVKKHIEENGHLKDIPSADEVIKNGISLGEMDSKLLQKIEELTLYTIEQDEKLTSQEKVNQELQNRLDKLESLISELTK